MKIMILSPGLPPWRLGGEEYYALYQAQILANLGHEVYVVAQMATEKMGIHEIDLPFKVLPVKMTKMKARTLGNIVTAIRYLIVALTSKAHPDIIHGHDTLGPGFAATLLGKIRGIPVVVTWHGAELMSRKFSFVGNLIRKLVCSFADAVIVNSELFRTLAIQNVGSVPASKFFVIPPGVDTDEFRPDKEGSSVRTRYLISDSFLVLSIGRLEHVKGFDILIRAVPFVLKSFPGTKFIVVGEGSQKETLRKLATTLGLGNSVIFAGAISRSSLPNYFSACNVFLVPTRAEGFGMVFLEAWASGKPIIVTPQAPAVACLVRRRGGGIVSSGDPESLAEALITLLRNESLRIRMGEIGRETALDFTWKTMVKRSLSLYYSLIDGSS